MKKRTIAESIKRLRKSKGLSQIKFAEKIKVPVEKLREWEKGTSSPSVFKLTRIAVAFDKKIYLSVGEGFYFK